MFTEQEFLIPQNKQKLDWYTKFIITLPAISVSIWCLASTTYNVLIYQHLHNILRNVTLHVET